VEYLDFVGCPRRIVGRLCVKRCDAQQEGVSSITDNHRHVSGANENGGVTYACVHAANFIRIVAERKPNDSFLVVVRRDPLLSPDLSLYQTLCLILIFPTFRRRVHRHNDGECDAYFSTVIHSSDVSFCSSDRYLVTTSFVFFRDIRSRRELFNTSKKTKLKNFDTLLASAAIFRQILSRETFDTANGCLLLILNIH